MKRMTKSVLDRALADLGAERKHNPAGGRDEVVVRCSHDGCPESLSFSNRPPELLAKDIANKGWFVGKKRRYCPAHTERPTGRPPLRLVEPDASPAAIAATEEPAVPPKPAAMHQPPITPAVRKPTIIETRKICDLVERYFDPAEGMYSGGYSDERIGDELDLPPALVALVRDEAFGKLKVNPHIAEAKAEVEALLSAMAGLESEFRQKLEKHRDQALALQTRIRNLERGTRP